MIFAAEGSIDNLKAGIKRRTRRNNDRYRINHTYAIQPGRTEKGIKEGRVLILRKWCEEMNGTGYPISKEEAILEGNYTPEEFEELYKNMHKNWIERYAYDIKYVKTRNFKSKNLEEFGSANNHERNKKT